VNYISDEINTEGNVSGVKGSYNNLMSLEGVGKNQSFASLGSNH
jgi:hypothetical protein